LSRFALIRYSWLGGHYHYSASRFLDNQRIFEFLPQNDNPSLEYGGAEKHDLGERWLAQINWLNLGVKLKNSGKSVKRRPP
jgi:hypothetical protein